MKKILPLLLIILTLIFVSKFIPYQKANAQKNALKLNVQEMTSLEKEFVLGQFLVKYKENAEPAQELKEKYPMNLETFKSSEENKYRTIILDENLGPGKGMNIQDKEIPQEVKDSELKELQDAMLEFSLDPNVEFVQPIYIYHLSAWTRPDTGDTPSDFDSTPSYATGDHWYYEKEKVRQMWQDQNCQGTGGVEPCGGDSDVIVAVLDTGLAYEDRDPTHYKSLFAGDPTNFAYGQAGEFDTAGGFNLYTNTAEINGDEATHCNDGIDEDGNGYIDDCHGYNAYEYWVCSSYSCTNSEKSEIGHPNDDFGHGTYVTGLIASNIDNSSANPPGTSVSPAFNVTIMPVKVSQRITHTPYPNIFGPDIYTDDVCNGIEYAADHGADVINMSFGGSSPDPTLESCIQDAYDANVVLVAATGNDGASSVNYPAEYSTVIAVGASDSSDQRASYSNYGSELDLVAAVGDSSPAKYTYQQSYNGSWGGSCNLSYYNTYDCVTHAGVWTLDDYTSFSAQTGAGTSYASPQVAAAAGLIRSRIPSISVSDVKTLLTVTATDIQAAGWDQYTGYGILNFEGLWNSGYFVNTGQWSDWFAPNDEIPLVGNFNNDDYDDVITFLSDANGDVYVALNNGGTAFGAGQKWQDWFAPNDERPGVGDFNSDSYNDIVTFTSWGDVYVALNNGGTGFGSGVKWSDWFAPNNEIPMIGDFNNDGYDDIVTFLSDAGGDVYVALNNGGTGFGSSVKWSDWFAPNDEIPAVGDLNNDGYDDIITFLSDAGGDVYIALNDSGTSFETPQKWSDWFAPNDEIPSVGDFNGDGYDDIVTFLSDANGDVYVALNNAGTDFGIGVKWNDWFAPNNERPGVGDFNNDSYDDIVTFTRWGDVYVALSE